MTFITCRDSWAYGWDADNQLFVESLFFCAIIRYSTFVSDTENGSSRLIGSSKSSRMQEALTLILLPLTSRRPRNASLSSPTVSITCVSSFLPRRLKWIDCAKNYELEMRTNSRRASKVSTTESTTQCLQHSRAATALRWYVIVAPSTCMYSICIIRQSYLSLRC